MAGALGLDSEELRRPGSEDLEAFFPVFRGFLGGPVLWGFSGLLGFFRFLGFLFVTLKVALSAGEQFGQPCVEVPNKATASGGAASGCKTSSCSALSARREVFEARAAWSISGSEALGSDSDSPNISILGNDENCVIQTGWKCPLVWWGPNSSWTYP